MKLKIPRPTYLLPIVALCSAPAFSQTGRSLYEFLDIPTSARVYGLGGTNISVIDVDVTLADQNPALIGPEIENQLAVNYMHYMGSGNFAGIRYGKGAGERGAWAAGIRYLNYGSFDAYEPDGSMSGSFNAQDIVFEGTYSHDFTDRLRGGINVKMVYSNYESYNAFAMATDLGINYYDDEKDLSLSAVLRNMGGQLKRFDERYDRVPFDIQLGYMQGLGSSPFSLAITATNLTKWDLPYYSHPKDDSGGASELKSSFFSNLFRHLIFGLQYQPNDRFYIDLAYNYKTRTDMSTYQRNFLSGFAAGVRVKVRGFSFGAAYAMPHKGGSSVMLNIACNFGDFLYSEE